MGITRVGVQKTQEVDTPPSIFTVERKLTSQILRSNYEAGVG